MFSPFTLKMAGARFVGLILYNLMGIHDLRQLITLLALFITMSFLYANNIKVYGDID